MANLFQPSLQPALDVNGNPVSGAKMYFFLTGTTTPATWYTNLEGTVPGTNPLVANSSGKFASLAYLDKDIVYRVRLTQADGETSVWPADVDPVRGYDEAMIASTAQAAIDAGAQITLDVAAVAADKAAAISARQGAEAAQAAAEGFADDADASAQTAAAIANRFADTTAGIAGTSSGDLFNVLEDGVIVEYENDSGVAVPTGFELAGAGALADAVADVEDAAATVGIESGNPNARVAFGGIAADTVSQRTVGLYGVREKALVSNRVMSANLAKMWRNVRFIGHSAVAGSGVVSAGSVVNPRSGINGSIPRHLEYLLQQYDPEFCVSNRGQSAQTSAEIASRMGAIPINITLASGTTLAASGAVTCTCTPGSFGPSSRRGTSVDEYYGYIGSQRCLLLNTGTGGNANTLVYSIEQVGGTGSITVNPGTPFILDPDPQDYAINIFWATRNDNNNQLSWDMQGAMVEKLPQDERRFIVMGDWNIADGTEDTGSTRLTNVLAENAEFARRYQGNFFDVRAFLRGEYPYDGSYFRSVWQMTGESSSQSTNDYSTAGDWVTNGRIPRRWMSIHLGGADLTHFNEQTYYWLAQALIEFHFVRKGWLA